MTKKIFLALTVISLSFNAFSQAYLKLGVGYNMAAPKTEMGADITTTKSEVVKSSYGKGISPALSFGYMFNEHLGAELGLSYLLGGKTEYTEVDVTSSGGVDYTTTTVNTTKAKGVYVLPALVVRGGSAESKLRPYARVGLALPVAGKVVTEQNGTTTPSNAKTEITAETKGKLSLGYTGAFGVTYSLSENLGLFVELTGTSLNIWAKSTELTKYSVNGTDQLANLQTIQKETEYASSVSDTDNRDVSKARKALDTSAPFSSLGLTVGVSYKF